MAFQYLDLTFYIPAAGGLICAIKASYLLIRYYMFPPDYGNMPKPTFVKPWLDKMATEGLNYHQAEVKLRNNLTHYYAETASRNAAVNEQQIALIKGAIVMSLWTLIFAVIATLGYYLIKQRFPEKKTQVKLVAASFQSTRIYA